MLDAATNNGDRLRRELLWRLEVIEELRHKVGDL
jgi:hypothetical protein